MATPPLIPPGLFWASQDYINSSLRLIGSLSSGELPSAAENQDALAILNQMLDSWQAQSWMIPGLQRFIFAPAALKQTYAVGPSGDLNIVRPSKISAVSVIDQPGSTQPIELALDMISATSEPGGWRDIPVKNTPGSLPLRVWDDCAYPARNLSFWPVPTVNVNFALYLPQVLTQFFDLVTQYQLPPIYTKAIRFNLAKDLMAEFPGDPARYPLVLRTAEEMIGEIKTINYRPPVASVDAALVNPKMDLYNWLTDEPAGR
ncbi:MAG TPA: hypothetical protein VMQ17_08760 [Candidatus Sulfotelmatobacter sp.]|nr:hypothetical protein [Candidatus Sulfotelmatobacter sp.]